MRLRRDADDAMLMLLLFRCCLLHTRAFHFHTATITLPLTH